MKNIIFIALSVFITSMSTYAKEDCTHTLRSFKCVKYNSNYDGDTIKVSIPGQHALFGQKISVRLNGIDTPERRTKDQCEKDLSLVAKDYLKYRILKSTNGLIELKNIQRGKYFRVVSEVWVNGRNINRAMIKRGLAVEYFGGTKFPVDWCKLKPDLPNDMYDFLKSYELNKKRSS